MLQVFSHSAYTLYIAAADVYSLTFVCLLLLVYQLQLYVVYFSFLHSRLRFSALHIPHPVVPRPPACGKPAHGDWM